MRPSLHAIIVTIVGSTIASAAAAKTTILDLQTSQRTETVNDKDLRVKLTNLNPAINAWYLLELRHGSQVATYNIENAHPAEQRLHLNASTPESLVIADYRSSQSCTLWHDHTLRQAAASHLPYAPLCDKRIMLRNRTTGNRSVKEAAVDFLRDHVWGGEAITSFVKDTLFKDKYLQVAGDAAETTTAAASSESDNAPVAARVAREHGSLGARQLGIRLSGAGGSMEAGKWYPSKNQAGVYVSEVSASRLAPEVLNSYAGSVNRLDRVESEAIASLVAFDLNRFNVGYALGTDHPRVDWSVRAESCRETDMGGPDGFSSPAPLIANGVLNPTFRNDVVATFAGGFKRRHGAFKWGALAKRNHGSHYGFIEDGIVFSKLQPGLATFYVKADGTFDMKTWTEGDKLILPQIRYARQNGVPIIERQVAGAGKPSVYVGDWARGNWSGSADSKFRTLRSGLCLQSSGPDHTQRHLIYGYFSTATPNSMARIFQAYGCEYAMHLDMNAPEHTYMALYHETKHDLGIEHLINVMGAYDVKDGNRIIPRFVGMPDNRDFVFLYKRSAGY